MRVLTLFFWAIIVLAVSAAVIVLVGREALLHLSRIRIDRDLAVLQRISANPVGYVRSCREKGSLTSKTPIQQLQLRFLSPTTYVTEVVCEQFPDQPIVVGQQSLFPFVTKVAGYSGVIWGDQPSGVVIEVLGRSLVVGVSGQAIDHTTLFVPGQLQPSTTCQGFSQVCCQPDIEVGVGETNKRVTDCLGSCYSTCQPRPVVLSLTTDPILHLPERSLTVTQGEVVGFSYVVSTPVSGVPEVRIEYGDGQTDTATALTGQFSHTYTCPLGRCQFTAQVHVRDANGVVATTPPLTRVTIIVQ